MKIIQLNIWQGRLLHQAIKFLKDQDADIICLQEIYSSTVKIESGIYEQFQMLEIIREQLPAYSYVFFDAVHSFDAGESVVSWGNAILSKIPTEKVDTFFTYGEFTHLESWKDLESNTRNAQIVTVANEGKKFTLVNHHGYHRPTEMGDQTTVEAFQNLSSRLADIANPILFCGDLNVRAESPAMRVFDERFTDLTATHDIKDTLSSLGKVPNVPCDHILITPGISVESFFVSEELISDHKALILTCDI